MSTILINLSLNAAAIVFFLFLIGIYFTKKNMDNIENKIYRQILLWNFVTLIMHMSYEFGMFYNIEFSKYKIFFNLFMATVTYYFWYLGFYTIMISKERDRKFIVKLEQNQTKISKILLITEVILTIIFIISPSYIKEIPGGYQIYGDVYNLYFVLVAIIYILSGFVTIKGLKYSNKKKMLPFLILIPLLIINQIILGMFPAICVLPVIMTLITYLMYHTIENPDIKLISELQFAKAQAEKSNEAKSAFLSSMSHEMKTPLNAIIGISQMMRDSYNNDKEIETDAKDILVASEKLLDLVNGVLDINSLESSNIELIEKEYNLKEELQKLIAILKIRINGKNMALNTSFSNELPFKLYGDIEKIKQILSNLITNAIKYTDSGSIDIKVECINSKEKSELSFTIKDTGRGIKEEQIPLIFDKFYRLEEDKDSDIEGTGLGLAITKSLVELLNGKIEVSSVYGQGSTFTVSLSQKVIELQNENNNKIDEEIL